MPEQKEFPRMVSKSLTKGHGGLYTPCGDTTQTWDAFLRDVADRLERIAMDNEVEPRASRDLLDVAYEIRVKAGMK